MAYLVQHARSPFWFLRFRDLERQRWREENLKLRVDCPKDSAKAVKEAAKRSGNEAIVRPNRGGDFVEWVPTYMADHYKNPRTLLRARYFWSTVRVFLHEQGIRTPGEITYSHAQRYLDWRKGDPGEHASHNTARAELKFLSFLMSEAIRRGLAETNGLALARVPMTPPKEKREITTAEITAVRKALRGQPGWMATAFELQLHLGCRFSETRIPMDRIDLKRKTIQIRDAKRQEGDPRKWFSTPVNDQLAAFLKGITPHDGHTLPEIERTMNRDFNRVLGRAAGGLTSHCLRVSFISRLHRAGLSESEAMRLVNHSTRMVHRLYSKLNVEDARRAMKRVPLPPPPPPKRRAPSAGSSSSRKKGTPSA